MYAKLRNKLTLERVPKSKNVSFILELYICKQTNSGHFYKEIEYKEIVCLRTSSQLFVVLDTQKNMV